MQTLAIPEYSTGAYGPGAFLVEAAGRHPVLGSEQD